MTAQSQEELERGQNRAKRALAESIAEDLSELNAPLNKTAERLSDLCATLHGDWEGAAADAFVQTVREISDRLNELGNEAKTISNAIKDAALSAYPD